MKILNRVVLLLLLLLLILTNCDQRAASLKKQFEIYLELGEYNQAQEFVEQLLRKNPADVQARCLKIKLLARKGEIDEALKEYEKLIQLTTKEVPEALQAIGKGIILAGIGSDHKDHQAVSQEAMLNLKHKAGLAFILELFKKGDEDQRRLVVNVLARMEKTHAKFVIEKALEDENPEVRTSAIQALGTINISGIEPALKKAIKDKYPQVSMAAVQMLSKLESKKSSSLLGQALRSDYLSVRKAAMDALYTRSDKSIILALRKALRQNFSYVRYNAAITLGKLGDRSAIPVLRIALYERDPSLRMQACELLATLGDTVAVSAIAKLLHDEVYPVREAAVRSLAQLKATAPLIRALVNDSFNVRLIACSTLGELRSVKAVPWLEKLLQHPNRQMRVAAATSLAKIGDLAILRKIFDGKDVAVQIRAIEEIGSIGNKEAVPLLDSVFVHSNNLEVRLSALNSLARLGSVASLQNAIEASERIIRRTAIDSLSNLGDTSSLPFLRKALKDTDIEIQKAALRALAKLNDFPILRNYATQGKGDLQLLAIQALGDLQDTASDSLLQKVFNKSDVKAKIAVIDAMRKIGRRAFLVSTLRHPVTEVQIQAIRSVKNLKDFSAIPVLESLIEDPDPRIRMEAFDALVELKALSSVANVLEMDNLQLKLAAVAALGEWDDPAAIPHLEPWLNHSNKQLRTLTLESLKKLRAVQIFIKALDSKLLDVRLAAASFFQDTTCAEAIPGLQRTLNDTDPQVRTTAFEALKKAGHVPSLIMALRNTNPGIRMTAARALGELGNRKAVSPLKEALLDRYSQVRREAALTLGRLKDKTAIPALVEALNDEHSEVRSAAAIALGRVGEEKAIPMLRYVLNDSNVLVRANAAVALINILN